MTQANVPVSITAQVSQVCSTIQGHLSSSLQAIHLFGSAVDSSLKPHSDIDLFVTTSGNLGESTRNELMLALLEHSAPPGSSASLRALEVTVVRHSDIYPWKYPAYRQMQFGEWLREDIINGIIEPATVDIDLAILIRKVRQHSIPILGPSAAQLFDSVPDEDFSNALKDTLKIWNTPEDWVGDEQNIILTLARIWYSAATGSIAPKEVAATWLHQRLPDDHQSILLEAQQAYLNGRPHTLASRPTAVAAFVQFAQSNIPL
jgi:streptomycin 3"-adenylyltransferase